MDLEIGQTYLRQRRELDAKHYSLEPEIEITAEDLQPTVFNARVENLITRFNHLPISGEKVDNDGFGRSFTVDIPESSVGADDEARLKFHVMDWGVSKSLSVGLHDPKAPPRGSITNTAEPLIEERVVAHQNKQTLYSEEDFKNLYRLEQSMAVVEQAVSELPRL